MKFYVDLMGLVKESEEWAGVPFFRFFYKKGSKKLTIRFFRTERDNGIAYCGEATRKTTVDLVMAAINTKVLKAAKKDGRRMLRRIVTWLFSQMDAGKSLHPQVGAIFCESELMMPKASAKVESKFDESSKAATASIKDAQKKRACSVDVDYTLTLTADKITKRFKRFVAVPNAFGITGTFYFPKETPDTVTVKITGTGEGA